jgi:hypothetical protein
MSIKLQKFHVAYYTNFDKTILSGKTYQAENILDVIELFITDKSTPSINTIKYISNEQLKGQTEKN